MLVGSRESEAKLGTARNLGEGFLRWFAEFGGAIFKPTKYFLWPSHPAPPEQPTQSGPVIPEAVVTSPLAAGVNVGLNTRISCITPSELSTQEIERRHNLVRTLFNDFWSGVHDKPAAFVQRLDQAEDYLNERLAAGGEFWRLDARTLGILGLPPRSNTPPVPGVLAAWRHFGVGLKAIHAAMPVQQNKVQTKKKAPIAVPGRGRNLRRKIC
jgi:hypothetical protein